MPNYKLTARAVNVDALVAFIRENPEASYRSMAKAGLGYPIGTEHKGLITALHQLERDGKLTGRNVRRGTTLRRVYRVVQP